MQIIQKRWTDTAGRVRSTVITWDHEGAKQEIERLEAAIDRRSKENQMNLSSKKER